MTRSPAHLPAAAGLVLLAGMAVNAAPAVAQPAPTSAVVPIAVQWSDQTTALGVAFRECTSGLWVAPSHLWPSAAAGSTPIIASPPDFALALLCTDADIALVHGPTAATDAAPCLALWTGSEPPTALSMGSVGPVDADAESSAWQPWSEVSGGYARIDRGQASDTVGGPGTVFWLHTLAAIDGDSGTPILADDGAVFAVQLGVHEPTGRSLAATADAIRDCLNRAGDVAP
jgi:hypothetical protein